MMKNVQKLSSAFYRNLSRCSGVRNYAVFSCVANRSIVKDHQVSLVKVTTDRFLSTAPGTMFQPWNFKEKIFKPEDEEEEEEDDDQDEDLDRAIEPSKC